MTSSRSSSGKKDRWPSLTETFNKAKETFPELEKSKPVGRGFFGLVVENDDNSLTKIFFMPNKENPRHKYQLEWTKKCFEAETTALGIFADFPLNDVPTPVLIGEPQKFDNEEYMGRYAMTRLPGSPLYHNFEDKYAPVPDEKMAKRFRNAGRMLAKFHKAVLEAPFELLPGDNEREDFVPKVKIFPDEVNDALEKADNYLRAHAKPGVIHGDYHAGNILVDENDNITGIIDFGCVSKSKNILRDFGSIMPLHMDSFTEGYEEESGEKIDKHVMTASTLGMWTGYLQWLEKAKDEDMREGVDRIAEQTRVITEVNKCLNDLIPVTGYKP